MRSAFGIEHTMAKGIRPDKTIDAAIAAGKKVKLKPVLTPLADARLGPRVEKSASGVSHAGQVTKANDRHQVQNAGLAATFGGFGAAGAASRVQRRARAQSLQTHARIAGPKLARRARIAGRVVHVGNAASLAGAATYLAAESHDGRRHRVGKSAFGIVHKGALEAADDVALAPGKVKAVTATVRAGQAVPAQGSSPKKPLTQKLTDAVTATGGSQT